MISEEDATEQASLIKEALSSEYEDFFSHTPFFIDSYPSVDIKEKKDGYILEAEIAGLDAADVLVKIDERLIIIQSKQEQTQESRDYVYLLKERRNTGFSRSFTVPNDVEKKNISINCANGLLLIVLPKRQ